MNLAIPLASLIQRMIARDKRTRVKELEPILVESYLAGSRHILAIDAANYFLFKPQSSWNRGRLLRGYGLSLMQSGDWNGASKALLESKALGVAWGINEDLAVVEALLRSDGSIEQLDRMLDDIADKYKELNGFDKRWYLRLSAEIDLRKGKEIKKTTLVKLPSHILFRAAEAAKVAENAPRRKNLLNALNNKTGGWSKLSDVIGEIDSMKKEITDIEQTLEKIR